MSWRGGYGSRGGKFGGRGGNRGGYRNSFGGGRNFEQGPPERVIPLGFFDYTVQDDLVCKVEIEDVPFFNAPIYLENKEQIGKIDEIFGNLRDYSVTIRLSENMKASSFKKNQKLFIDPAKLLPLQRFLPKPPGSFKKKPSGKTRGGGGGRFSGRGGGGGSFSGGYGKDGRGSFRGRGGFGGRSSFGNRNIGNFSNRGGGGRYNTGGRFSNNRER